MAYFRHVPDFGANAMMKPNVRTTKFGDGYEQRQANGINNKPRQWSLSFSMRDNAEADAIEAFLEARGGVEAFDWTDPRMKTVRVKCAQWNRIADRYNLSTITATFEQVFEAAA